MEIKSKWKSFDNVQETWNIDKVDLKFGFDNNKQPLVERFELYDGDRKIKYEPIKKEQIRKTYSGIEGYEEIKRSIYLTEVDEFFPEYKKIKRLIEEGKKVKCDVLVKRMETVEGNVYYNMYYDGAQNLKIVE